MGMYLNVLATNSSIINACRIIRKFSNYLDLKVMYDSLKRISQPFHRIVHNVFIGLCRRADHIYINICLLLK